MKKFGESRTRPRFSSASTDVGDWMVTPRCCRLHGCRIYANGLVGTAGTARPQDPAESHDYETVCVSSPGTAVNRYRGSCRDSWLSDRILRLFRSVRRIYTVYPRRPSTSGPATIRAKV